MIGQLELMIWKCGNEKFECIIILWVMVFLLVGCSRNGNEEENDGKEILVNLDIRVALSDVSQPTRSEDADAESDDEKIQTLRIVVVRPDGIVEGNRFVPLVVAAEFYGYERFRVVGNEEKRIYLLSTSGHGFSLKMVEQTLT